jgi:hypothetical protein
MIDKVDILQIYCIENKYFVGKKDAYEKVKEMQKHENAKAFKKYLFDYRLKSFLVKFFKVVK